MGRIASRFTVLRETEGIFFVNWENAIVCVVCVRLYGECGVGEDFGRIVLFGGKRETKRLTNDDW